MIASSPHEDVVEPDGLAASSRTRRDLSRGPGWASPRPRSASTTVAIVRLSVGEDPDAILVSFNPVSSLPRGAEGGGGLSLRARKFGKGGRCRRASVVGGRRRSRGREIEARGCSRGSSATRPSPERAAVRRPAPGLKKDLTRRRSNAAALGDLVRSGETSQHARPKGRRLRPDRAGPRPYLHVRPDRLQRRANRQPSDLRLRRRSAAPLPLPRRPWTQVMNLTDVDDKTIRGAQEPASLAESRASTPMRSPGTSEVNVDPAEHYPKATDHVPEMIDLTGGSRSAATVRTEGSVYSASRRFKIREALGIKRDEMRRGDRVADDEYEKRREGLRPGRRRSPTSPVAVPLGTGAAGWHIECSAMSMTNIWGSTRLPPARWTHLSAPRERDRAERGSPGIRSWTLAGTRNTSSSTARRCRKSKGNFYTLDDVLERARRSGRIRYLVYRPVPKKLNFTWDVLAGAAAAVERIRSGPSASRRWPRPPAPETRSLSFLGARGALPFRVRCGSTTPEHVGGAGGVFTLPAAGERRIDDGSLDRGGRPGGADALTAADHVLGVLPKAAEVIPPRSRKIVARKRGPPGGATSPRRPDPRELAAPGDRARRHAGRHRWKKASAV